MGYYIEVPRATSKTEQIVALHGGQEIHQPVSYSDIPEGKGLIVVIDNGLFEAAGFAYSEGEFKEFTDPGDHRPRRFVLLDRKEAEKLSNYSR